MPSREHMGRSRGRKGPSRAAGLTEEPRPSTAASVHVARWKQLGAGGS